MREYEFEVLYALLNSPPVGVNQLYRELRGKLSKAKLVEVLARLRRLGLVTACRDPRHKQRLLLSLRDDLAKRAGALLAGSGGDAVAEAYRLVKMYVELTLKVRDPVELGFLKELVLKEIGRLLTFSAGGTHGDAELRDLSF